MEKVKENPLEHSSDIIVEDDNLAVESRMIPKRQYYHQFPPRQYFPPNKIRRNIPFRRMNIRPPIRYPEIPRQNIVPNYNLRRIDENFVVSAPESSSQSLLHKFRSSNLENHKKHYVPIKTQLKTNHGDINSKPVTENVEEHDYHYDISPYLPDDFPESDKPNLTAQGMEAVKDDKVHIISGEYEIQNVGEKPVISREPTNKDDIKDEMLSNEKASYMDFYHMDKLATGFNEVWDKTSFEKELFSPDESVQDIKKVPTEKYTSGYVTVYDKEGINELKQNYGNSKVKTTSETPKRPVPTYHKNDKIGFRSKFSRSQDQLKRNLYFNPTTVKSDRMGQHQLINRKFNGKLVKNVNTPRYQKSYPSNLLKRTQNKKIPITSRIQTNNKLVNRPLKYIQNVSNNYSTIKRNGLAVQSRQIGVANSGNIVGDTIRNSIPFVGNNIADLIFPTQATSARPDPSFGTERQGLLQGNGYDQMLVLLRPPPRRQPFGGLLSRYIDIDYETFIALLALAGAAAGFALNQVIATKGRRMKRSVENYHTKLDENSELAAKFLTSGLDDFEVKIEELGKSETSDLIDSIKQMGKSDNKENHEENDDETNFSTLGKQQNNDESWFSFTNIVKEFFKIKDEVDHEYQEEKLHEEELEYKRSGNGTTIIGEEEPWLESNSIKKKRSAQQDDDSCKLQIWRCLSGVMESGIMYLDKPSELWGAANKYLFKMAFHGIKSGVWGSLMTIPEARKVARCMREHDNCMEQEIYARELDGNQDGSRKRVIVDTEFLQDLDQSDGSTAYDDNTEDNEDYYDALDNTI